VTYSIANNVNWLYKNHNFKFGAEFKQHQYDSDLPEEQATEFEKFDSFTQLLTGNATEADTQYGITAKQFRFRDLGFYMTDTWKLSRRLTLNAGLRYELFMWPTEKNGYIGNFDLEPFQNPVLHPVRRQQRTLRQSDTGLHRSEQRRDDRARSCRWSRRDHAACRQQAHAQRSGPEQLCTKGRPCICDQR
jgi:outer membrane receptor protein involved in Fe transport